MVFLIGDLTQKSLISVLGCFPALFDFIQIEGTVTFYCNESLGGAIPNLPP